VLATDVLAEGAVTGGGWQIAGGLAICAVAIVAAAAGLRRSGSRMGTEEQTGDGRIHGETEAHGTDDAGQSRQALD